MACSPLPILPFRRVGALVALVLLTATHGSAAPQRNPAPAKASAAASLTAAVLLEKSVVAHQAAARKLAAKSRWSAALGELGKAQKEVRVASRSVMPTRRLPAAYQREARALRLRFAQQRRLADQGKANLTVALQQYSAGRKALDQKYGLHSTGAVVAGVRPPAGRARFLLLSAALSDQSAEYFTHSGNRVQAQKAREDGLRDRLVANRVSGKSALAEAAAEKLLALNPSRPDLFRVVGGFYEEAGRYERAVPVWQRLAQLLETGRPTGLGSGSAASVRESVNRQLAVSYRRLAFCQSRLGKKSEAEAALRKAAEVEARVTAPRR